MSDYDISFVDQVPKTFNELAIVSLLSIFFIDNLIFPEPLSGVAKHPTILNDLRHTHVGVPERPHMS
jgi:hypothetical protein